LNLTLTWLTVKSPCGGGVEYLHRDPASRRRRQKGKSHIWDSIIWSQAPRDSSDPRMTALASVSSIYKRQTCPLVREGAPPKQDHNCQTEKNIWSWAPDGARHQDWLTDRQSQCDFDSDVTDSSVVVQLSVESQPVKKRLSRWKENLMRVVVTMRLL
jgi:hypothetical protein